jgi:CHAT domain-containing protein/predicted negative regulator of RcsB-dependent stress response
MKKLRLKLLALFLSTLLFCLSLTPVIAQIQPKSTPELVQQAKQFYNSNQYREAIPFWQKAIENLPANSLNQGIAFSNLSLTYQQLGEWLQARENINKSLQILQSLQTNPEQQRILAQSLEIQGQLFYKTGQSQEALNSWQQANKILKDDRDKKINLINQAQAMQDLGLYPRACKTLLEVLDLNSQTCNISSQDLVNITQKIINNSQDFYQVKALRNLGNILRVIGDLSQSNKVLQASLELVQLEQSTADKSKILLNLANTERALARQSQELSDDQEATKYRNQAFNNYQQVSDISSSIVQVQAKLNQLEILLEEKQWTQAEELIQLLPNLLNNLPLNRDQLSANIKYTQILLCLKQQDSNCLNPQQLDLSQVDNISLQQAVKILENSAKNAAILEDKRTLSYILGLLGRIYESRQEWQLAEGYTQQALSNSWQAQARDLTYQWQWQQGRILKAQGNNQAAVKFYQQAVQTLQSLRSDLVSTNPEVQFTFRESVEPIYRQYVDLLLQPQKTASVPPENLQLARETIDSLQLAELENFFRLVCLDANPVIIDQVTEQNDPNAAVIYPILLDNRFEIIVKFPQQPLRHYTTAIEDKKVVLRILERLPQILNQANSQEILPLAQTVYDWLLRPIQADLAQSSTKTLVFVLDSTLRNIPMAVLNDGQQYLVEKYSIALIPSLQLFDPQPLRKSETKALIAGLSEARAGFPPLPFVPQELQQIQAQFTRTTELFNQNFTNQNLQNTANNLPFSVLHLATHGQFSSQIENTFILTWDNRLNIEQLNSLIRSRNSQPLELLVLSACETLTGDKRASLGLAGVAIRAGAKSTLATLWQVNDRATALLMNQFYNSLSQDKLSKAEALRQAQLTLLKEPTYQSPHFWAAYVLLGNWL